MLGGSLISPCDEKQQLAWIVDALEDLMVNDAIDAALRESEIGHEINAGRLLTFGWRQFADRHGLGVANLSFIEAQFVRFLNSRDLVVGDDLADAQVVILEDLEPTLFLDLVMDTEGAPADDCLLIAPSRQRQHPPLGTLAAEALVVDEAVDPLKVGLQGLGQAQVVVEAILLRLNYEYHGEHRG